MKRILNFNEKENNMAITLRMDVGIDQLKNEMKDVFLRFNLFNDVTFN
jgi:hypothetical protein